MKTESMEVQPPEIGREIWEQLTMVEGLQDLPECKGRARRMSSIPWQKKMLAQRLLPLSIYCARNCAMYTVGLHTVYQVLNYTTEAKEQKHTEFSPTGKFASMRPEQEYNW